MIWMPRWERMAPPIILKDVDALDKMSQKLDEFIFDDTSSEFIEQVKNDIFNFNVDKLSCYTYDY